MKIIITGFEPFSGASSNPSQLVINELKHSSFANVELITAVLPVEYELASEQLLKLISENNPEMVIALGQAEGRTEISIERIAINLADAKIADNGGDLKLNQEIYPNGAPGYFTTLPIIELIEKLRSSGFKASQSLSAGSFVCNYIFYQMQKTLSNTSVKSGFIHLPLVPEQQGEFPGKPTMELSEMVSAIKLIIEELAKTN